MSNKVERTEKGDLRLKVAGKRYIHPMGSELPYVEEVLTDAAAVVPRRGDRRDDIKAWKVVCGWNAEQITEAAKRLRQKMEKILQSGEEWERAQKLILNAFAAECPEVMEKDDLSSALANIAVCGEWETIEEAFGKEITEKLSKRYDQLIKDQRETAAAAGSRRDSLAQAAEQMSRPVRVEIAQVSWGKVPGGLSGRYLVALSWMFANTPEALARLTAREGVDSQGES